MRPYLTIVQETLLTLRRDKLLAPALIAGVLFTLLAALVGYWGIEEFGKILYDLGGLGYHITGVVVAMFWGTKMISDSRQSGYWEVQLAAPLRRTTWIIAKFTGLILSLLLLAVILLAVWHVLLWYFGMRPFYAKQWQIFGLLTLGWFIMAAVSVLFASLTSQALALFCSSAMWIAGLSSSSIAAALSPETPEVMRSAVEGLSRFWNLHLYNFIDFATSHDPLPMDQVQMRLGFGVCLIVVFLAVASVFFSRKDLASS